MWEIMAMKKQIYWKGVVAIIAAILTTTVATVGQAQVVIAPNFQPDPKEIGSGTSGGPNDSRDCGYIAGTPNLQIQLTQQFTYLRFTVQGAGQPTLLIEGPSGRFCGLGKPEIAGLWKPGVYKIYAGQRTQQQHPFQLSVTASP